MNDSFVISFLSNSCMFLGSFRSEASEWPILGVAIHLTRTKPPLFKANPSGVLFANWDEFLVWNWCMTDPEQSSVVKMFSFFIMSLELYSYYWCTDFHLLLKLLSLRSWACKRRGVWEKNDAEYFVIRLLWWKLPCVVMPVMVLCRLMWHAWKRWCLL